MEKEFKINILGETYIVKRQNISENPKLENNIGLCEQYSKEIIVQNIPDNKLNVNNINELARKVLRHEIIHAFLGESGLRCESDWAENEEMVDWFAIQLPKIISVIKEAEEMFDKEGD